MYNRQSTFLSVRIVHVSKPTCVCTHRKTKSFSKTEKNQAQFENFTFRYMGDFLSKDNPDVSESNITKTIFYRILICVWDSAT